MLMRLKRAKRRCGLAAVAVTLLAGLSACEWQVTPTPGSTNNVFCSVATPVPPASSSGATWLPDPRAVTIRFGIVNADAQTPFAVGVLTVPDSWKPPPTWVPPTMPVWNGGSATGFVTFPASPRIFVDLRSYDINAIGGNVSWTMAALDANGEDVGFLGCGPFPTPP